MRDNSMTGDDPRIPGSTGASRARQVGGAVSSCDHDMMSRKMNCASCTGAPQLIPTLHLRSPSRCPRVELTRSRLFGLAQELASDQREGGGRSNMDAHGSSIYAQKRDKLMDILRLLDSSGVKDRALEDRFRSIIANSRRKGDANDLVWDEIVMELHNWQAGERASTNIDGKAPDIDWFVRSLQDACDNLPWYQQRQHPAPAPAATASSSSNNSSSSSSSSQQQEQEQGGAAGAEDTTAGASAERSGGGSGGAGAGAGAGDDDTSYAKNVNILSRLTERGGELEARFLRKGSTFKERYSVKTHELKYFTTMTPETLNDANTSLLDLPTKKDGMRWQVLASNKQLPRFLHNYSLRKMYVVDGDGRKHMATAKTLVRALQGLRVEEKEWMWCLEQALLKKMGKPSALDSLRGTTGSHGAGSGGAGSSSSGGGGGQGRGGGAGSGGAGSSSSGGGGGQGRGDAPTSLAELMKTAMPLNTTVFPRTTMEVDDDDTPIRYLVPVSSKILKQLRDEPRYYDFPSCFEVTREVKSYNLGKMYAVRRDGKIVMVGRLRMKKQLDATLGGKTVPVETWMTRLDDAVKIMETKAVTGRKILASRSTKKRKRAPASGKVQKNNTKRQKGASADDGHAETTAPDTGADEEGGGGGGGELKVVVAAGVTR